MELFSRSFSVSKWVVEKWVVEKRLDKSHLAKNSDYRARGVGSNMEERVGQSSRQGRVTTFDCGLMSHPGSEEL